ncbi:MAG: ATP-binding protein [Clostridium sp.]
MKILMILIVFLTLTLGSTLVSIYYFNKLQTSIDSIMNANYDSVVAAQNMIEALERQDSIELSFIFEGDKTLSQTYENNRMKFLEWLYKAKNNITEQGEKETINGIEKTYNEYTSKIKILESLKRKEGLDSVKSYYYSDILPLFSDVKEDCTELLSINQKSMVDMKDESKSLAKEAMYYTIAILGAVLTIGLCIIGYLLKKIIRPIEDLTIGIKEVSEGNYSYKIPLEREKDINYVLEEFNHMAYELRKYEMLNINEILMEKQKGEAIIESIDSPIIVTDYDNRITMVNKSAERILDIKEKTVINRHFLEGIENREIFNIINKARESIKTYRAYEDIEISQKDTRIYYRVFTTPIWFENNENIGAVTIMYDITKFKEVEMLKSEFLSTVSHEFRTPLTSISMAISLLLEEGLNGNEDDQELLNIIKEDSERLNNLVSELLDFSKIESGKIEMDIQDINIMDVIDQVKRAFKIQFEEKNIKLNVDCKNVYRYVKADFTKISWVFVNLLGNAIRYISKDGTGFIEISAKEFNNNMLVSISDNGKGISEDNQKRIFEKFVQLKDKNDEESGSSGLGLAICKEIVKAHCGEIWVDSTLGEGSKFFFTLKLGGMINEEDIDC